jgi:hypothetical protein
MPTVQRIITSTAIFLAAAALSTSSAAAMSVTAGPYAAGGHHGSAQPVSAPPAYSRQDKQVVGPATPAPASGLPAAPSPRFSAPATGFTLTDGFITMGGVLLLLAVAGSVAVARNRRRGAALTH